MKRKQRSFTPEFKVKRVVEYLTGAKRRVDIVREYQISDGTLDRWIHKFHDRAPIIFGAEDNSALVERDRKIADLEQMIGRLTMELEASKKASSWLTSRGKENAR